MKMLKFIAIWIIMLFIYQSSVCQAPQGFKYQAVCRDSTGTVIQDQSVNLRLSVHDLSLTGNIIYQETFTVVTNQFGLIMLDAGRGNVQSGVFADIPWEAGDKFLEIELDMGTGYFSMGTTQLLSVPYSLYARSAESLTGGITETDPEVGTNLPNYLSKWDGLTLCASSIFDNGNIGIGTESAVKKLTVGGNAQIQSDGDWYPGATARLYLGPDDNMWIEHIHSGGLNLEVCSGWPLYFRNGGSVTMAIDGSGNVGVGTMYPSAKLDVWDGNISVSNGSVLSNYGFFGDALRTNWGNDLLLQSSYENRGIIFNTYSGEKMRIVASGNVGIGTTSPAATLDVNGQVKIAGGSPGPGKVLTSDVSGLATWETPASAGAHYIGETYGGGIVFYIYDNGQHGLIAATSDQSSGIQWSNGVYRYTGTTGDGLAAGAMNTALIVATQMSDNETGNFAAKVCTDYAVTENGIIYGDWYLPSKNESDLLYLQKDVVGGFSDADYWTSTEEPWANSFAKHRYFGNGAQTFPSDVKYHPYKVRAIRAF
jgi:hypothetical protein